MGANKTYLQSLGSLQLLAIVMVVIGHFGFKENAFMNSLGVSFCFVYSGYFTARRHQFGKGYNLRKHCRFMLDKIAKFYPLHLLALALGFFAFYYYFNSRTINLRTLFYQLTMLSSWIPDPRHYFGFNPVAWYLCDLFFLYLVAPLVVKALRRCGIIGQVSIITLLLLLEYLGGYRQDESSGNGIIGLYHLYQFPPIRLLDFAAGVILFNITQLSWWSTAQNKLKGTSATLIECSGVVGFLLLCWLEKNFLFQHCYRAFCVLAPGIIVLLMTFLFTSQNNGLFSRMLSINPIKWLSKYGSELFLLQFGVFYTFLPTCNSMGLTAHEPLQVAIYLVVLVAVSWLVHHCYVLPVNERLSRFFNRILPL